MKGRWWFYSLGATLTCAIFAAGVCGGFAVLCALAGEIVFLVWYVCVRGVCVCVRVCMRLCACVPLSVSLALFLCVDVSVSVSVWRLD